MDEVEARNTIQYDMIINNGINFVKQEVLKGLKMKEKMKIQEEQREKRLKLEAERLKEIKE